jgi:hypothetical protein
VLKSLIALMQVVLAEAGTRCGTSTTQDLKTILRRVEHEGISFLTISLPAFCSDFEKSLAEGRVTHDRFTGFSRTGGLPRFLKGFLESVFDSNSGRLLNDPSIQAIQAVRQITLMFGKIALQCSPEREDNAIRKFIECEQDVRRYDRKLSSEPERLEEFVRVGRLLWADFFSEVDNRIYAEGVIPRHGPGATADKLRGNAKYDQLMWTFRMESVFPHWENLIPSESFLSRTDRVTILEPGDEIPVKVILVPKTLKTPRIIAVEPTCMQYMQQGVLATIMEEMPRFDNTRHFVMFESQEPNQRLAREGSVSGALATLDLSEASDRVSNQHVRLLLASHRELRQAVDVTRSRKADVTLPGGIKKIIRLAKFASMGSALCFPMEAMVFATIIFVGIQRELKRPLTKKDIQSFFGLVRVYGDDIIVPVEYVQSVIQELEAFGLRVNPNKSFWTGRFRESCGKEFYDGRNVCVARVRNLLPSDRLDVDRLQSTISFRNQMFHLGYHETADYLDGLISDIITFPFVEWTIGQDGNPVQSSSLLGRHAYDIPCQEYRHDSDLQIPLVRGSIAVSESPASLLDDYGALMKWFLKRGVTPFVDRRHLQRAGRPRSARIKTGWYPIR